MPYRRRSLFGTLTTLLLLCVIVLVGIGFWRGWFSASTPDTPDSDEIAVTLKIDREKIRQDAEKASRQVEGLRDAAEEPSEEVDSSKIISVRGVVTGIDLSNRELQVDPEEADEFTVTVDEGTELTVNERSVELDAVNLGDNVSVSYRNIGDENHAEEVRVARDE